jgi:hypothetical protein
MSETHPGFLPAPERRAAAPAVQSARSGGHPRRWERVKDTMDDVDEPVDDDVAEDLDEGDEPTEAELADATTPPDPVAGGDVESIQELLVKQEARDDEDADDEEDAVVALTKDERLEPAETRVVPMQATEFVCKRCYLVKHRSQLADKKRTLCRDCA